jgi:hypothetical protein
VRTVLIGVLAFAGGALAGGLFVKWYVERHAGQLAGEAIGEKLTAAGYPTLGRFTSGLLTAVDEVRA